MGDWRPAKSLQQLFKDLDAIAPGRSRVTDGLIGDKNHHPPSDHIPDQWMATWPTPGPFGVVHAADVTHDPADGADMAIVSEQLRAARDPRTKYIIFNRRIASARENWVWREFTGDPHSGHMHISVNAGPIADDISSWRLQPGDDVIHDDIEPTSGEIVPGQRGEDVLELQLLLIRIGLIRDTAGNRDRHYGDETVKVIKRFQRANGLVDDGRVGTKTRRALMAFDRP